MENNYEEIYDQASFLADIWDQLPKEFVENKSASNAVTSYQMIIWDCSELDNNNKKGNNN